MTHGPGLKCPVHARRAQYKQFYFGFTNQSRVAFTTYYLVKTAGDGAVKVKKISKTSFTKVNNNLDSQEEVDNVLDELEEILPATATGW